MGTRNSNCIELARKRKNLTLQQLADKLHIEYSIMKGIELGVKFPSLDILIKMCALLEVSSDALLLNETRKALCLDGLSSKQIKIVMELYRGIKDIDEER